MSEPLFTRRFWILFAAHFLAAASILALSLLPLFIQKLGGDALDIGLLMAASVVSGILARPMIGRLMDLRGRRVAFLLSGVVNFAGALSYLLVSEIGPGFYAARLFHGIGMGGLFAAFFTGATDLIPNSRRAEGIAVFGTSGMAAAGLGPLLGEMILKSGGFPLYFCSLSVLGLASLLLTMNVTEIAKPSGRTAEASDGRTSDGSRESLHGAPHRRESGQGVLAVLTHPAVARLWPVVIGFGLTVGSFNAFVAPFVKANGLLAASAFFMPYAASSITLRIAFSKLPDRIGPERVLPPALASLGVGAFTLTLLPSNVGLIIGGILGGLGHGYVFPALSALALSRSDPGQRGTLLSLFTSAVDMGALLGGPLLGLIARAAGFGGAFLAAGVCSLAGIVYFRVEERARAQAAVATTVYRSQSSAGPE